MPDFRENGVIRCARLESKKSASGAVKKNLHGGMVAQNVEGGVDSTPPAVLGLNKLLGGKGSTYVSELR